VSGNVVLIYRGKKLVGKEGAMLSTVTAALLRFAARFEREEGQALAEYGLILALIAVAAILSLTALGLAVAGQLDAIEAVMP
jgi:Flp pilus assembly pilin Flp